MQQEPAQESVQTEPLPAKESGVPLLVEEVDVEDLQAREEDSACRTDF